MNKITKLVFINILTFICLSASEATENQDGMSYNETKEFINSIELKRNNQPLIYQSERLLSLVDTFLKYLIVQENQEFKNLSPSDPKFIDALKNVNLNDYRFNQQGILSEISKLADPKNIDLRKTIATLNDKKVYHSKLLEFIRNSREKNKLNIPIYVNLTYGETIAAASDHSCKKDNGKTSKYDFLYIDDVAFTSFNDRQLEEIIMHELGHLKKLDHKKRIDAKVYARIANCTLTLGTMLLLNKSQSTEKTLSYGAVSFLASTLITKALIRKFIYQKQEREADNFAFKNGYAQEAKEFLEIMKKVKNNTPKNMTPFKLKLEYFLQNIGLGTHPTIDERIKAADDYMAKHPKNGPSTAAGA